MNSTKKCMHCDGLISEKAIICPRCGEKQENIKQNMDFFENQNDVEILPKLQINNNAYPKKSRKTAAFLAFFFGAFGVHKFYLGDYFFGFVVLVLGVVSATAITLPFAIIQGILLLLKTDEEFDMQYQNWINKKKQPQ